MYFRGSRCCRAVKSDGETEMTGEGEMRGAMDHKYRWRGDDGADYSSVLTSTSCQVHPNLGNCHGDLQAGRAQQLTGNASQMLLLSAAALPSASNNPLTRRSLPPRCSMFSCSGGCSDTSNWKLERLCQFRTIYNFEQITQHA